MKKIIASLALVGLSTLAFAQDAPVVPTMTLGAYLDTGVTYFTNLQDKAFVGLWGDDAGYNGGRFKLTGKVAAGDYGFNFELRADGLINTASPSSAVAVTTASAPATPGAVTGLFNSVYFKSAYVYGNFFNKTVSTQVGLVNEQTSRTGGDAGASFTKETPGAVVVLKPVDGLSVNGFIAPSVSLVGNTSGVTNAQVVTVSNAADTISSVGGSYTLPNVFKVVGQAKFQNPRVAYTKAAAGFGGKDDYTITDFYAGAGLLAVPNLTAWVEYQYGNLNNGNLAGKTTVTETLAYGYKDLGLAPLSTGVIAYQYLYDADLLTKDNTTTNPKADALGLSLRVHPWVSYALDGGITPKLMVSYLSGATVVDGKGYFTDLGYGSSSFVGMVAKKKNENNIAVFEVKPSVKFDLNKTMALTFIGSYMTSIGADNVSFGTSRTDANSAVYVQSNFTYSF